MRIGLHGRNDYTFTETDYAAIRTARIETLKIMDFTTIPTLQRVRQENPEMEFIVRLYDDRIGTGHQHPSPQDFVTRFIPRINSLRPYATKYEIHNEPNHYQGIEGWGSSDADAQDFRQWYLAVLSLLRQACPWARFGFPGLAPNYPHRDLEWLDICRDAVLASDWLGCHTYWQYDNMFSQDWGLRFISYRARFPTKIIEITEFGNSTPGLSRQEMATQYAAYYQRLQQYPYLGSACSFICSSPDPTWLPFAWCDPRSNTLFPVVFTVAAVPHTPPPPEPVYRVAYLSNTTPATMTPGQRLPVTLTVRNDGNFTWQAAGDQAVRLNYRWLPAGPDGVPTPLPRNVAAGESISIDAQLLAPAAPASYTLRWDMMQEGVGWFADKGATPLTVAVRVQQAGQPSHNWVASASDNAENAQKAIDGDPTTTWTSIETQRPGMWFMIDLGSVQEISMVSMVSPEKDFPRGYVLEVSTDGVTWDEVAHKDPNWKSVEAVFPPTRARYVRITQTRVPRWPVPWSISDVVITTAPIWKASADPNLQDAAKAIDGDPQTVWTTVTPQQPGAWFQLDLGDKLYVERLRLNNTSNPQYPRGYVIRVSLDGQTWQEVARKASNWAPVDAKIGPAWMRYIHIENTRGSPWHPWTIAEVEIVTAPPA